MKVLERLTKADIGFLFDVLEPPSDVDGQEPSELSPDEYKFLVTGLVQLQRDARSALGEIQRLSYLSPVKCIDTGTRVPIL